MNPEKIGEQIAKSLLIEQFTEKVSLYPGAFKPPHKGHVATALKAIDDKTDRVIIFMSTKERDGVSVNQAQQVWDLYKQNNPELEKVEIVQTPVPVKAVYDYAKDNPSHDIRAVFGKGEQERFQSLLDKEKYPHVEVFDAGMEGTYSATELRKAIRDNDLETINEFVPDGINVDDFMSIFQLNEAIVGDEIVCDNCGWHWKIVDGGDDLFICHKCGHDNTPLNEASKKKTQRLKKQKTNEEVLSQTSLVLPRGKKVVLQAEEEDYDRGLIVELTKEGGYKIYYWYGDDIKIYPAEVEVDGESIKPDAREVYIKFHPELKKEEKETNYLREARYKKFLNEGWDSSKGKVIGDFVSYVSEYLSINKPKIKLINSPEYTEQYSSFGGYLPSEEKIMVVVHNRNMADILRTVAHEMVHHMQNLDDRLTPKSGEDGSPDENEANSLAAVIMRKFGRENPHIYE